MSRFGPSLRLANHELSNDRQRLSAQQAGEAFRSEKRFVEVSIPPVDFRHSKAPALFGQLKYLLRRDGGEGEFTREMVVVGGIRMITLPTSWEICRRKR